MYWNKSSGDTFYYYTVFCISKVCLYAIIILQNNTYLKLYLYYLFVIVYLQGVLKLHQQKTQLWLIFMYTLNITIGIIIIRTHTFVLLYFFNGYIEWQVVKVPELTIQPNMYGVLCFLKISNQINIIDWQCRHL